MRYVPNPLIEKDSSPAFGAAFLFRCLAAGLAVLFAAGCASETPMPPGSRFVVSASRAQFYKNGPAEQFSYIDPTFDQNLTAQQVGPDFELPKGTRLTMLKHELGFSRLVTDDGVVGYVSNDQLRPAPAVARISRPVVPEERPYRRPRQNSNPQPRKIVEPPLDLNDVPLPLPG